jgi:hypothetical protein
LCVVHCLPSAIRLEDDMVPDAFWSCAERRSKEALTDPDAIPRAIDTTQTRIGLVLSLTLVMNDLLPRAEPFYMDACASHHTAGQQNGFGTKKAPRLTPQG